MVNGELFQNGIGSQNSLGNQQCEQHSAESSVFHSHEKISSISFDSWSQNYQEQIWIDPRKSKAKPELLVIDQMQRNQLNPTQIIDSKQSLLKLSNQYDNFGQLESNSLLIYNQSKQQDIFDNYNDSLEIMDQQQFNKLTNQISSDSQNSNQVINHIAMTLPDQQFSNHYSNQYQQQHEYSIESDQLNQVEETIKLNSFSSQTTAFNQKCPINQKQNIDHLQVNTNNCTKQIGGQSTISKQQEAKIHNQNQEKTAAKGYVPEVYLNSARKQIEMQMETLKSFCEDKHKIRELMTHCLYSIYRQQDLNDYFDEMVTISKLMRDYYLQSLSLQTKHQLTDSKSQQTMSKSLQVGLSMTQQLHQQLQSQVQPRFLKEMISDIIAEIMKSICHQILAKMKYLGIIVKEPLFRRASVDDFTLCFDYFSRKNANNQNLIQGSSFGLSLGNYGVFTNNINLKNLNQQGDNYDQDDSSLSAFSQSESQKSQFSSSKQQELIIQEALKKKRELFGGISKGQQSELRMSAINCQLLLAFKQHQELYLDNGQGYELIRQEGKRSTWRDIKNSRTRLQHFIYRQQEYKQAFDMIMRSYYQLKNSLEHLEEFWLFLFETIYDQYQHGKLQFDKVWKNLFLENILDNIYIKNFLNDVSDQYDSLQNYNQQVQSIQNNHQIPNKHPTQNHRYILDEIYENLIKLENDLNEDYIMKDLCKLINIDDCAFNQKVEQIPHKLDCQDQNKSINQPNTTLNFKTKAQIQQKSYQYQDELSDSLEQNQNSAVIQQLNLVIANQYELI